VGLIDDGLELAPGMTLTFLPGHTMGQMGLRIERLDGRALFCADAIHGPVQLLQPSVSTSSCLDPVLAAATRRALLEEASATGRLIVPAHFRGARRTAVRAVATGFRPILPG
jgi:glyoxylase-like metal-dependent hydrolase (beta-lactamase superfamily II)